MTVKEKNEFDKARWFEYCATHKVPQYIKKEIEVDEKYYYPFGGLITPEYAEELENQCDNEEEHTENSKYIDGEDYMGSYIGYMNMMADVLEKTPTGEKIERLYNSLSHEEKIDFCNYFREWITYKEKSDKIFKIEHENKYD